MKLKVYIETTIPSYLTAWRSPELIKAANQEATKDWWETASSKFELYISEVVIDEAMSGNKEAAQRRLDVISDFPKLDVSIDAENLAIKLISSLALPEKAKIDALHIAIAAVHGIEYLLTWNCKHIANAVMRPKIEYVCRVNGYEPPIICTPLELMGE